jgi:hypothetical protein
MVNMHLKALLLERKVQKNCTNLQIGVVVQTNFVLGSASRFIRSYSSRVNNTFRRTPITTHYPKALAHAADTKTSPSKRRYIPDQQDAKAGETLDQAERGRVAGHRHCSTKSNVRPSLISSRIRICIYLLEDYLYLRDTSWRHVRRSAVM